MKPMNPLDFHMLVIPPSCKLETNNFRGIVAIQFLISIKLSFKWALDEVSRTKLVYLPQWMVLYFLSTNTAHNWLSFINLTWWWKIDIRFEFCRVMSIEISLWHAKSMIIFQFCRWVIIGQKICLVLILFLNWYNLCHIVLFCLNWAYFVSFGNILSI